MTDLLIAVSGVLCSFAVGILLADEAGFCSACEREEVGRYMRMPLWKRLTRK